MGSNQVAVTSPSDFAPASSKEFLDIQATTKCGFTLKRVRDMIKTYSQMHRTDKYSQHSSIIWPAWLNGWVFVYELSGCGFESSCSHFTFRFRACFEQGVPWHSGNYKVWIHSETRTWYDKNIKSNLIESPAIKANRTADNRDNKWKKTLQFKVPWQTKKLSDVV